MTVSPSRPRRAVSAAPAWRWRRWTAVSVATLAIYDMLQVGRSAGCRSTACVCVRRSGRRIRRRSRRRRCHRCRCGLRLRGRRPVSCAGPSSVTGAPTFRQCLDAGLARRSKRKNHADHRGQHRARKGHGEDAGQPEAVIDALGLAGDAHAGDWTPQVSLLGAEAIGRLSAEMRRPIGPGEFAENLTVAGLDAAAVGILDRFRVGTVELEVTQIGKECHGDGCAIFRESGRCSCPARGSSAASWRVASRGRAMLEHMTASAAGAGHHPERPRSRGRLRGPERSASGDPANRFLVSRRFHPGVERILLPDDPGSLRAALEPHARRSASSSPPAGPASARATTLPRW